jgi:hypothetical protein
MYIVELEEGVWMAPWPSDPGRTCKKENARKFDYYQVAVIALDIARKYRPFVNAKIVDLNKEID